MERHPLTPAGENDDLRRHSANSSGPSRKVRGGERDRGVARSFLAFPSTGFHFVNAVAFRNDNNPRKVSLLQVHMSGWTKSKLVVDFLAKEIRCPLRTSRERDLSSIKSKNWTIFDNIFCAFLSLFSLSYRFLLRHLTKVKIISKQ